jgi:uncharacterized protein YjbI with pentapeptide repeats
MADRPGWTWKDRDGKVRVSDDLQRISEEHTAWLTPARERGSDGWWESALKGADLREADLTYFSLEQADLEGTNLREALLSPVDLNSANMRSADLSNSDLTGAILTDAYFENANLSGLVFEPRSLTRPDYMAAAHHLELMTYESNPGPLNQLRKQFQDAGFRDPERAITYAINRRQAALEPPIERWFKWVAFDLTCQYGYAPGRPLRILLWLWFVSSFVYAVFMHRPGKSGIYLVGTRLWRSKSTTQAMQIRPRALRTAKWWNAPFSWLRREWRLLRAASFFSLMSAFNIGFRDINFGRWMRLLTRREYDLKAVGWARTVSGFQSLLSVYLIALWVLTYFGRPFA